MKIVKYFRIILLLFVLVFTVSSVYGQYSRAEFNPYWELDFNGGMSTFFGDLKQNLIIPENNEVNEWKYGGGFMFGRQFSPVFGWRVQFLTGELLGSRRVLDRYFESNYYEANLNTTINLNNLLGKYNPNRTLNFYLVAGVGLTNYNSILYQLSANNQLSYQGFGNGSGIGGRVIEGILVGGMGVDFRLSDHISIKLETVNRGMNSDLMDIWQSGSKYDVYNYTSFGIAFKLGKGKKRKLNESEVIDQTPVDEKPVQIEDKTVEEKTQAETQTQTEYKYKSESETKAETKPRIIVEPIVEEKSTVVVKPEVPEPEYRVQIRANYLKRLSVGDLSEKYNIPTKEIKEDTHNGYYIYTIGSMDTYYKARALRDKLRSVNRVYDAFVVAFSKGKRLYKLPE